MNNLSDYILTVNWNRNLFQAEYKCYGPGAETENRASWSLQLTDEEAAPYLSVDFVDGQKWLPAWL